MNKRNNKRAYGRLSQLGVTLIELLIVVMIIAVLAAIAVPTYSSYIGRTRRVAAEGCLMQLSSFMERYYTTNLSYAQDTSGTAITLPTLDCMQPSQTGNDYTYAFGASQPTGNTYTFQATPSTVQQKRDAKCGTLTVSQTGTRTASGTATDCWQ